MLAATGSCAMRQPSPCSFKDIINDRPTAQLAPVPFGCLFTPRSHAWPDLCVLPLPLSSWSKARMQRHATCPLVCQVIYSAIPLRTKHLQKALSQGICSNARIQLSLISKAELFPYSTAFTMGFLQQSCMRYPYQAVPSHRVSKRAEAHPRLASPAKHGAE